MAARDLLLQGVGRASEGEGGLGLPIESDHRAVYRGRPCLVRFALEYPGEDQQRGFRVFRAHVVALARARHSTIPAVFEMGTANRRPFAIIEHPEGETLAERLRWGPLPESAIVALGARVMGGLAAIHRRGLSHGHLTPARIVFVDGDEDVRIVGFGAPPKTEGARDPAHPRCDLAALGRVLYECATGRAVYAGSERAGRGLSELPELSGGNEPLTSPELSSLIARLVRCESDAPPPDAAWLIAQFERLQAGTATSAPPSQRPMFELGAEVPDEVPLVGRASAMRALRNAWTEVRAGNSAIVHLRGAPGMGKSRLAREFLEEVAGQARLVLTARCTPGNAQPFATLGALLNEHVRGARDADGTGNAASALRDAGQEMAPLLKGLSPELAQLFGDAAELGAPHELQALFAEAMAEFLLRLCQSSSPTAIVVDDLHAMDAGSRAVLTRVADRMRSAQALLVVTSRPDAESAAAVDAFFRPMRALTPVDVTLEPLRPDECRDVIEAYLGTPGVPADVTGPLVALGDGTPMSLVEMLHAITSEGLLLPYWGNWRLARDGLDAMQFPTHTREILARRVADLSAETRRVVGAAAVLGHSFDQGFLARIVPRDDCESALREAHDARVLVPGAAGQWRFVHESVRHTLLSQMSAVEERGLHQRVAEALDADGGSDTPAVCRRAAAYAAGEWEQAPERVFATNYDAGLRTFASFDNEQALSFLIVAEDAAARAGLRPDARFYQTIGEIHLRRGSFAKSRRYFELALGRSEAAPERGVIQARLALVAYTTGDAAAAWRTIEAAFASLSHPMPSPRPMSVARSLLSWRTLRRELGPIHPAPLSNAERLRIEALCALHYQAERMAIETDDSLRFLAHVLESAAQAERLGPSPALVRSSLLYGFAQVACGFTAAGVARVERAAAMADAIHDPVMSAYSLQIRAMTMAWAGHIDAALAAGRSLLLERAHWLELNDYCLFCFNQNLMLGMRGDAHEAWEWVARALEKIRHEPPAAEIVVFVERAALAALTALGRGSELESYRTPVPVVSAETTAGHGRLDRISFGSRIRAFTECGALGVEFEELVHRFRASVDARRAHLALAEFFVHVAHARVHQCLRARGDELPPLRRELARSVHEVGAIARIPLVTAHQRVLEAYEALFAGSPARASVLFSSADRLAQDESCPWVLFAVARGRAHLHARQGRADAARDQAILATTIAEAHGYEYRARWVREEFGLPARDTAKESVARAGGANGVQTSMRRTVQRLIALGRAGAGAFAVDDQARLILDEIIQCLNATHGAVCLSPERGGAPTVVAERHVPGDDLQRNGDAPAIVHRAFQAGATVIEKGAPGRAGAASIAATPLVLGERVIGAVYIETKSVPSPDDVRVLEVLVVQAALALELTRTLRAHAEEIRERKILEDDLRQAQKMEALGRLAGTIAHDFNNLIAIITATLDCVQMEHGDELATELADIRDASHRATALTQQLLTFSRRQSSVPQPVRLNATLASAAPFVRRLLPETITLVTRLDAQHDTLAADPNRIHQVLLNLAANARDAMPTGGTLTIATRDVHAATGVGEQAQDCLLVTVQDTGEGMPPDVLRQAFEPFFTTKSPGKGTGLGLATVHGIVRQMHGRITVDSTVGKGTTFSLYLPVLSKGSESPGVLPDNDDEGAHRPLPSRVVRRPCTVLLVDDERLMLMALERGLIREGFRVLSALSGEEAIALVRGSAARIDVVVVDVHMPRMSGVELVDRLRALGVRTPHLFISGFAEDLLADGRQTLGGSVLAKPFSVAVLVARVRALSDAHADSAFEAS